MHKKHAKVNVQKKTAEVNAKKHAKLFAQKHAKLYAQKILLSR
jgi:hypothetical protein